MWKFVPKVLIADQASVMLKKAGKLRRAIASLVMVLLLLGLFAFVFTVQPAKAQSGGAITINPDGSISGPVPANITTSDDVVYTFTGNNYLPIVVNRSNIIINGTGYMEEATEGAVINFPQNGFSLNGIRNVTIENTTIAHSYYGIYLNYSSDDVLRGNSVKNNEQTGVFVEENCNHITISRNNITNDWYGVFASSSCTISGNYITNNGLIGIQLSSNCTVSGNYITNNVEDGVYLLNSSYSAVSGNIITNDTGGVGLEGSSNCNVSNNEFMDDGLVVSGLYSAPESSFHNFVENDSVNGKPLVYFEGVSDRNVSDAGQVVLVDCESMVINGLNLSHTTIGVELWQTNNTRIENDNMANDGEGIEVYYCSNCTVSENNLTNNDDLGVDLTSTSNCTVSGNNITANAVGISLDTDNYGLRGVWYFWGYSHNNTLSGNNIVADYRFGLMLDSSSGNEIFHNDFLHNTQQTSVYNSTNTWDDGYPSGGNYWSNYTGVDQKSGPYQNLTGSDGIGDTPYVIDANNTDRYPLMGPFHTFSVGTWNGVAYSVDRVSNSTLSYFRFNASAKTLTFNVTGPSGTTGFCRVAIPKDFMWCDNQSQWLVLITEGSGSQFHYLLLTPNTMTDANYTYLYFNYTHSTHTVLVSSTHAVLEFQPFMLLPLFMTITLLGAVAFKRKRSERQV
jgi:parallel beta-helix repeat protein